MPSSAAAPAAEGSPTASAYAAYSAATLGLVTFHEGEEQGGGGGGGAPAASGVGHRLTTVVLDPDRFVPGSVIVFKMRAPRNVAIRAAPRVASGGGGAALHGALGPGLSAHSSTPQRPVPPLSRFFAADGGAAQAAAGAVAAAPPTDAPPTAVRAPFDGADTGAPVVAAASPASLLNVSSSVSMALHGPGVPSTARPFYASPSSAALAAAAKSAQVTIPEPLLASPWHAQTLGQLRYGASLVSAALAHLPEAADERPRAHAVRQPHAGMPACFPSAPEARLPDSAALFERLSQDTLFFVFYYSQGGYPQFLAARELRQRHSWRFHRQHRTWFQRYAEPAEVTEEGERGAFVYFDESDWTPKVAANFFFAYADLCEDVTV